MATNEIVTVADAVALAARGEWDWHLATVADIQTFLSATLQTVRGEDDPLPTSVFLHTDTRPLGTYVGAMRWDGNAWDTTNLDVPVDSRGAYSWQTH